MSERSIVANLQTKNTSKQEIVEYSMRLVNQAT
jgi:hypothetical protein